MKTIISKRQARTIAVVLYTVEKRAVAILLSLILLLACSYVYFLGTAVVQVVERKEIQHTIANVSSRIATLEVDYFNQKSRITEDLAVEMNFTTLAQKEYVDRTRYLGRAGVQ